MNSRELIDKMNHDRQREAAPSSTAVTIYTAAIAAAMYCTAVFLFTL
jgi:hypothetical protein